MRATMLLAVSLTACIPRVDPPAGDPAPPSTPAAQHIDDQRPPESPVIAAEQSQTRVGETVSTLPAPRPAWDARPVIPDAQTVRDQAYIVRPGDTLNGVAAASGAGTDAIARANALRPPFLVRIGQRLTIPGGRYHLVETGQSGIAIARAYGVSWARVIEANGLVEPFILRAGQRLLIPDPIATAAGFSTAVQRAATFTLDIDAILTGGEPALSRRQQPAKPAVTASRVLPATAALAPPASLSGGFAWPVRGQIVSRFGPGASGERQNGVNIAIPLGTPVRATADGVVVYVGSAIAALGGLVIVKHGGNWTSVYGYAARLLVQRGQAVKQGQPLAVSGQTGYAARPSVHFELRHGRTPVDPQAQLPPL